MRTSETDPIKIAEVSLEGFGGRIGITLCPGKRDVGALWARDLDSDLDAIRAWGASAVVCFMELHELALLRVERLPAAVREHAMEFVHLPIVDVSTPSRTFEDAWAEAGPDLLRRLRGGASVLLHCRGGLGRSGMIAARLLVELGEAPASAIRRVRAARPGAIETPAQERYVLAQKRGQ